MTKNTPKKRKSQDDLCKYFDKTKEELDKIVSQLYIEHQTFLKELYTEDYQRKKLPSKKQSASLAYILTKINQLIDEERVNDLCKYFDKTKEELDKIVLQLSTEHQTFLKELYTEDYQRKNQKKKKLLNKVKKSRDDLCKYFDKTKEELDKIVVQLSIEYQTFLKELYTEDYQRKNPKQPLSKKQNNDLVHVLKRINQLLDEGKVKVNKSRDDLCNYYGKTKEELEQIVLQLSSEDMKSLKEFYDEDYKRIISKKITTQQKNHLFNQLNYIIKGNLVKKEKVKKSRDDLCNYYGKTKEEIDQIVLQLSSEDVKSLKEFYDKDYKRIISKKITTQQKNHLFYQLNCIIQGKTVKTKSTTQSLKEEKNVVEEDLTKEDYQKQPLSKKQKNNLFHILERINQLLNEDKVKKNQDDLCNYYGKTEEEIQKLLKMLNQDTIEKQAKKLPIEDSIIFILRNEIYENKEFSVEAISEFLQEDPKVIKELEKRALMTFKQQLTSLDSELEESERQKILSLKG